jgi:hypothetical protein
MTIDTTTAELCLFELEAKLKEAHVLAVDLGGKINEALELVQFIRNIQTPPYCMLCSKQLQLDKPANQTEQYICGECLLDPHRRDEINKLLEKPKQ